MKCWRKPPNPLLLLILHLGVQDFLAMRWWCYPLSHHAACTFRKLCMSHVWLISETTHTLAQFIHIHRQHISEIIDVQINEKFVSSWLLKCSTILLYSTYITGTAAYVCSAQSLHWHLWRINHWLWYSWLLCSTSTLPFMYCLLRNIKI